MRRAGRVDDHDVVPPPLALLQRALRDLHRVSAVGHDRDPNLASEGEQLLHGGGALEIGGHQEGSPPLLLETEGELRASGRLPRALDTGHHHDRGSARRQDEPPVFAAQRFLELVPDDLDDLLRGSEALHHLLGEGASAHAPEERVGHLHGDVGLQQRRPHVIEGVVHLLGMELASSAEFLEGAVETGGQGVEHGVVYSIGPSCEPVPGPGPGRNQASYRAGAAPSGPKTSSTA
jgi:hypothetical protein